MADYLFTLDDNIENRTKLIQAIPSDWKVLKGALFPAIGEKQRKISFNFEGKPEPTTTLRLDVSEEKHEHVQRISCMGPPPLGFIEILNQGELYKEMGMEAAKAAAIHVLRKGFGGVLNCAMEMISSERSSVLCSMIFDYKQYDPEKSQLITIKMMVDEHMGGKREELEPILRVCRSV